MGTLSRANRNIRWIEQFCCVPEGKHIGNPVKLRPWQKKIIRGIYDGKTRMAIISFGRKTGKTTLSAFLCLLHLCGPEARPNSQLYSAAQSREQAALLFDLAAKMVRMSPALDAFVMIRDSAKQLYCPELGTKYRALSADASTAYGLSPIFVVHDELGQVRGPRSELFDALETGAAAHDNPLSIVISTQAPGDSDLLSRLIDRARSANDPRYKLFIWEAPADADPFDLRTIKAANPAFGDFQNADEILRMAEEAKTLPEREAAFRNLVLNQRVDRHAPFIAPTVWKRNGEEPDIDFTGATVWGGLDLSQRRDTSALVWVADRGDGKLDVLPRFWLPAEGIVDRSLAERVPYDVWAREGYLTLGEGATVDYKEIALEIVEAVDRWNVAAIGYDPYLIQALWPILDDLGLDEERREKLFVKVPQTYTGMSTAIGELEAALHEGRIRHGNHPMLTMHAANARVHRQPVTDQRLLRKPSEYQRIDGVVALAIALGVRAAHLERCEIAPIGADNARVWLL